MKRSGQKLRKFSEVESGERGIKDVSYFSVQQWKDLRRGVRQKLPPCFVIVLFLLCLPFDNHWATCFDVTERMAVALGSLAPGPGLAYGWHSLNAC